MTRPAAELGETLEAPLGEAVGRVLTTGKVLDAAGVLGELPAGTVVAGADGARGVPTATVGAGAAAVGAAGGEQLVDPMAVSTIGEQLC